MRFVRCGRSTILPPCMGRAIDVSNTLGPSAAQQPSPPRCQRGRLRSPPTNRPLSPTSVVADWPEQLLAWVDGHRRMLFAGLAVFYLLSFNGQWRMEPDSALYLTLGQCRPGAGLYLSWAAASPCLSRSAVAVCRAVQGVWHEERPAAPDRDAAARAGGDWRCATGCSCCTRGGRSRCW